jgi:hypothetical protein
VSVPETKEFTPYSSVKPFLTDLPNWFPDEDRERIASYDLYDQIYWNEDTQFKLRTLEGEEPLYIPTAMSIVDTTAHYWLKGLKIVVDDPEKRKDLFADLNKLLKREEFYSRFHMAKHAGVARGDFVYHLTADVKKPAGSRISMNDVHPGFVIPIYEDDRMIRCHLVDQVEDPKDKYKILIHKLTYEYEIVAGRRRVMREEALWEIEPKWWGPNPTKREEIITRAPLPEAITNIPIYWFKNKKWSGQDFGSSELRGFVKMLQGISQSVTDQGAALSLEGLGVYATDSGRPVNDSGKEVDWMVSPGKVMEVATGGYFRRVEGLGTLKPSLDHIGYLENKLNEAGGLSSVARGDVDVQTAQSGIALAIKFLPTLAKLEERDTAGVDKLQQMFFDWKMWQSAYENITYTEEDEILATIGDKLPQDRVANTNELNNMLDRGIISKAFYRSKMQEMGYVFPDDMELQIEEEKRTDAELAALAAPPGLQANAQAAAAGEKPLPASAGGAANAPKPKGPNRSNNKNRVNESKGTEATQSLARQAGGKPGGK